MRLDLFEWHVWRLTSATRYTLPVRHFCPALLSLYANWLSVAPRVSVPLRLATQQTVAVNGCPLEDLLGSSERNAWQCQREAHRFHVADGQLARETHRDCWADVRESGNHRHRETGLEKQKTWQMHAHQSRLPIAVSGMAIVVVSVAMRKGPWTDKPHP